MILWLVHFAEEIQRSMYRYKVYNRRSETTLDQPCLNITGTLPWLWPQKKAFQAWKEAEDSFLRLGDKKAPPARSKLEKEKNEKTIACSRSSVHLSGLLLKSAHIPDVKHLRWQRFKLSSRDVIMTSFGSLRFWPDNRYKTVDLLW
jgi:hypothetical protein